VTTFWVGTSGWHYKHWRDIFYPRELSQREWFAHYAGHFPTVELNNSFYRQPKDSTWEQWRRAAPEGFRFAVKANRFLTHIKRFSDSEAALERFLSGAERLGPSLGPVLFQTPANFHRTDVNLQRLESFLSLLPASHRFVFEFRHASWLGDETLALLRSHGAGFCIFDMPSLKCPIAATADFAYLRMHGTSELYASNYTDEMLQSWAKRLRELSHGLSDVWVYFNNDIHGFAVSNARKLRELLAT
jgi:uncharacterized protein YecE (DUF72 family)